MATTNGIPIAQKAAENSPASGWKPIVKVAAPLLAGLGIALTPVPHGLSPNAWHYFALFAAVIVGIITEPIPAAAVGLAGVIVAAVSGLVYTSAERAGAWALSGLASSIVWFVFAAYMFALGYTKTGLGKRIALLLIRALGMRTLGLAYALGLADLALAPFMPSYTARSGGMIFPIIGQIPGLFDSRPHHPSARKIGAYLMYAALAITSVTSSMFLTGAAFNLLAVSIVAKILNVNISWAEWFKGFAPVGIVLFALVPVLLYIIYPPEIKESPDAPRWAEAELRKMGPITGKEITMLALVVVALAMWIGARKYIDATLVALLVVVLMVPLRLVPWHEIIGNGKAWEVLVWFATLLTMADGLVKTKFVDWVAQSIAPAFSGHRIFADIILVVGAFYFLHYLFAGGTPHVSALLPLFLAISVKIPGVSPKAWALLLSYTVGLMVIITPYAGAVNPIYYGCGFIRPREFWLLGTLMGLFFFIAFIAIGVPWLMFLKI